MLLSALSYVGSRSSSNMAIVEVKMLSGFGPMEGTNQFVSLFCFLHLVKPQEDLTLFLKNWWSVYTSWYIHTTHGYVVSVGYKVHQIDTMETTPLGPFFLPFPQYILFPWSWKSFGILPQGSGKALDLSLFYFPLFYSASPTTSGEEGRIWNWHTEHLLGRGRHSEGNLRAGLLIQLCNFPSNLRTLGSHTQGWGNGESESTATKWILPPRWCT